LQPPVNSIEINQWFATTRQLDSHYFSEKDGRGANIDALYYLAIQVGQPSIDKGGTSFESECLDTSKAFYHFRVHSFLGCANHLTSKPVGDVPLAFFKDGNRKKA
jgi:hypothetical protein